MGKFEQLMKKLYCSEKKIGYTINFKDFIKRMHITDLNI